MMKDGAKRQGWKATHRVSHLRTYATKAEIGDIEV